nr:hypothetical protein [Streptomyces caatingaensis]
MATARKTAARRSSTGAKPAAAKKCPTCKGEGTVTFPVMVGRRGRQREVAQQEGLCPTCLGSGEASTT